MNFLMEKTELINLLRSNKFWAKKSLGQNFLVDESALEKIVKAAELKEDDLVIEIGPGMGVLTTELVKRAGAVIAIEKDEELAEYLRQSEKLKRQSHNSKPVCRQAGLKIICEDILKVNIPKLVGNRKYKVVANIPYYITSKIIRLFLEQANKPELMVLLVQKEVAERICAKPGDMSVLSVSVQYYGRPEIVDIVPASSFFPVPKINSAILKIDIINCHSKLDLESRNYCIDSPMESGYSGLIRSHRTTSPYYAKATQGRQATGWNDKGFEKEFFRLVNIGFASRRKTLTNNLMVGYKIDKNIAADIITSIGLKKNVRAQELTIEQWSELCRKTRG